MVSASATTNFACAVSTRNWNRVFSYGGTLVNEPNGQPMAVVTFTDITESKHAEERLRRSQEQLAE